MFLNGQVCKENFHPFANVRDDVTKSLDVCHRFIACESIVSTRLPFDRVNALQFKIQTNFGLTSSTQRLKRNTSFICCTFRHKFGC